MTNKSNLGIFINIKINNQSRARLRSISRYNINDRLHRVRLFLDVSISDNIKMLFENYSQYKYNRNTETIIILTIRIHNY